MYARLTQSLRASALRHRGFRLLWVATLLSSTARWADVVVVGWLTLELTESPLMVGIVAACKMAGYIAAPFMGVAADRMDRRMLLIIAALVSWGVSALMLVLLLIDALTLQSLIILSLIGSFTWALDNPTRQALVPDLVKKEDLTNAIALNAVATEITVVAGPALGGLLIPTFGISGAYWLMTGIYLLDLIVLYRMDGVKRSQPKVHEPPLKSLVSGFQYAWCNQTVLVLLAIAFLLNLLAAPYRYSFLPLFARYILDAGAAGYGILTSVAGLGALLAGVWVVYMGNFRSKGRLLIAGGIVWPAALLLFAMSKSYYMSLALVFVAGLAQAITWTLIATLILANTGQSMRGRVMGLRTGVVISLPFGNFLAGAAAERFGAPLAMGAYSACAILIMIVVVMRVPALRKLE